MPLRPAALKWGRLPTLALVLVCALVLPAAAQPKKRGAPAAPPATEKADKSEKADAPTSTDSAKAPEKGEKKKGPKEKNFDFNAMDLNGRMRTPQLLYFLERANEELERASLEKRSFIPHMVRSVEEEQL